MNTFSEYQNVTIRVGTLQIWVCTCPKLSPYLSDGRLDRVYELMRMNREILVQYELIIQPQQALELECQNKGGVTHKLCHIKLVMRRDNMSWR
jgi:hypothetical protein